MQREEWVRIQQEAREQRPQTQTEAQSLAIAVLLAELVDQIYLLREDLKGGRK